MWTKKGVKRDVTTALESVGTPEKLEKAFKRKQTSRREPAQEVGTSDRGPRLTFGVQDGFRVGSDQWQARLRVHAGKISENFINEPITTLIAASGPLGSREPIATRCSGSGNHERQHKRGPWSHCFCTCRTFPRCRPKKCRGASAVFLLLFIRVL